MKELTVKTENKAYKILIKNGILDEIENFLPDNKKIFLITNECLAELYSDFVSKFQYKVVIKDGEEFKNFETYQYIIEKLLSQKIERQDVIAAFGGGVAGDMAGFTAATVLRGVQFIQIPSTLLAQVDSSIGGKTGFNTKFGKNLVGAFYQPNSVLIDPELLSTLPEKQLKTGLGEVVKYAFIEKNCMDNPDFYLFDFLLSLKNDVLTPSFLSEIIYRCAGLKASVVSRDEKEAGLRAVLNFGHTFAHPIETLTGYSKFTHGEAVAMGIKYAFELALNLGLTEKEYYKTSIDLINKFNLIEAGRNIFDKKEFLDVMKSDKKVVSSKIRLVLPVSKGKVEIFDNIEESEIERVI